MGLGLEIGLLVVLVIVNAAFAGAEIALVSLRETQLAKLAEGSPRGRAVAHLARDPNRFLSTIQIGITLAGFLASAVAAVSIAEPLRDPLDFLGDAAEPVAVVLVTVVLSFFTLVVGELAPKRLALQRAERWAMVAARPLGMLSVVLRPAVWILGRATDLTVKVLGGDPGADRQEVTGEELREMVAAQRDIPAKQRALLEGAFEVADRTLESVMVPRTSMRSLDADELAPAAVEELIHCGHSRAPVHEGSSDDVVGVVHLRDLLASNAPVRDHVREPILLPENARVLDTLGLLQRERQQMAIVVSEHGGVEGLVTVEDLLEEIVGEIYDEFDRDLHEVRRTPDGGVELPGDFPIHDLPDIGLELPEGDYSTVAGLVLDRLGHIPEPGEDVRGDTWHIEVNAVEDLRISHVTVRTQR